jgi:hypothetical protein
VGPEDLVQAEVGALIEEMEVQLPEGRKKTVRVFGFPIIAVGKMEAQTIRKGPRKMNDPACKDPPLMKAFHLHPFIAYDYRDLHRIGVEGANNHFSLRPMTLRVGPQDLVGVMMFSPNQGLDQVLHHNSLSKTSMGISIFRPKDR